MLQKRNYWGLGIKSGLWQGFCKITKKNKKQGSNDPKSKESVHTINPQNQYRLCNWTPKMVQILNLGRPSFAAINPVSRNEDLFTLHYEKHQKCDADQGPQMFGNSYLPEVQQLHKILFGESSLLSNWFDSMLCYLLPPSSCTIPTTTWASPPKQCSQTATSSQTQRRCKLAWKHYIWCSYGVSTDLGIIMLGVW